jgi:hypothetical protein
LLRILRTALALDTQLESTAPLRASLLRTLAEGLTKAGKSLPREDRAFEPVLRTLAALMNESLGRHEDARTTPGANILHTHLDVEVLVALLDLEHSLLAARLSDVVFLLGSAGVTSSCPDVCLRLLRGLVSVYARLRQLPELLSTFLVRARSTLNLSSHASYTSARGRYSRGCRDCPADRRTKYGTLPHCASRASVAVSASSAKAQYSYRSSRPRCS